MSSGEGEQISILPGGSAQAPDFGCTWQQLLDGGIAVLEEAGVTEAGLDAWYLLEEAFSIDRVHFFLDRNRPVREALLEKFYPRYVSFLEKRARRYPLQYILGKQDFMGMTFKVDENVLIPRQDTETLVETVLREHPERDISVLDLCTGSGCIAISLAVLGQYGRVTASDLSREALRMAKKNASSLFMIQKGVVKAQSSRVSEQPWRVEFTTWLAGETRRLILAESDLFSSFSREDRFDVIVSNPPYIPSRVIGGLEPEVRDYEPRMALDGAEDGLLFYRRLASESGRYLKDGGSVYFEIGYDQAEAVTELLLEAGFDRIEAVKDGPGLDRVVKAVLGRRRGWKEVSHV